jgi:hypothetical protein
MKIIDSIISYHLFWILHFIALVVMLLIDPRINHVILFQSILVIISCIFGVVGQAKNDILKAIKETKENER